MILKFENLYTENLQTYKEDILLNKKLTNISDSNMYDILFDSENFDEIINLVLKKITDNTNEDFSVYVKNMWGYVQTETENQLFNIAHYLKEELSIKPKYSFVFVIESNEMTLQIKNENISMNSGDLIIFSSENFVADKSTDKNRIILIGSLTNNLQEDKNQKKLL